MPQGMLLGPMSFNLHINGILKRIPYDCSLVPYADNCMIFAQSIFPNDSLNQLQFSTHKQFFCQ